MRLGASRSQLYDAQKSARALWDGTHELWDDHVRSEFEEQTWLPLDEQVSEVLRAIDLLTTTFTQIRHDCEFGS